MIIIIVIFLTKEPAMPPLLSSPLPNTPGCNSLGKQEVIIA